MQKRATRFVEASLVVQNANSSQQLHPDFSRIIRYCEWELLLLRMQTRVLSHFTPPLATPFLVLTPRTVTIGAIPPTIVGVCRTESTAKTSDMEDNDQSSIIMLGKNKRNGGGGGGISNFRPSDKTKLSMVLFSYTFFRSFHFIPLSFYTESSQSAFNTYLWHSYILYVAILFTGCETSFTTDPLKKIPLSEATQRNPDFFLRLTQLHISIEMSRSLPMIERLVKRKTSRDER